VHFRLPDSCSFEAAALAEPLSVVLHAVRRSGLRAGDRVLVLGAGAIGLLACAVARAQGATTTIAVDIDQPKLDFAKENGWATGVHCLERGPRVSGADAMAAGKKAWEGLKASQVVTGVDELDEGFDVVMECTGVESCMQMAVYVSIPAATCSPMSGCIAKAYLSIQAARAGGKALFIGMGTSAMLLPTGASLIREVDIMGVFRYANTYPAALALLGSGQLPNVEKLVTHRYPLDQAEEAFADVARGKGKNGEMVVKVMIGKRA